MRNIKQAIAFLATVMITALSYCETEPQYAPHGVIGGLVPTMTNTEEWARDSFVANTGGTVNGDLMLSRDSGVKLKIGNPGITSPGQLAIDSYGRFEGTFGSFSFVNSTTWTDSTLTPDGTDILTKRLGNTLYEPLGGYGPTSGVSKAYVDASILAATNFVKDGYVDKYNPWIGSSLKLGNYGSPPFIGNIEAGTAAWIASMEDSHIWFSRVSDTNQVDSLLFPDGTYVLTTKKAETDYPAITNAYCYADASTLAATNFVKAGYLCKKVNYVLHDFKLIDDDSGDYLIKYNGSAWLFNGESTYAQSANRLYEEDNEIIFKDGYWQIGIEESTHSPVVTSNMLNGVLGAYQTNFVVSASTSNKVLSNDGTNIYWAVGGGSSITTNAVKDIASSAYVTNAGAVAYSDANMRNKTDFGVYNAEYDSWWMGTTVGEGSEVEFIYENDAEINWYLGSLVLNIWYYKNEGKWRVQELGMVYEFYGDGTELRIDAPLGIGTVRTFVRSSHNRRIEQEPYSMVLATYMLGMSSGSLVKYDAGKDKLVPASSGTDYADIVTVKNIASSAAITNAGAVAYTRTYVAENADYELSTLPLSTNIVGGVKSVDCNISSGVIGDVATGSDISELGITLNFTDTANRSGDCMVYIVNAAPLDMVVKPADKVLPIGWDGAPIPAGTNVVSFTRVKRDGLKSLILIKTKEIE